MTTTTKDLPATILGVKRTVTEPQAHALWNQGELARIKSVIGMRYLIERGKAKSVRALAEQWGISKSTVDRVNGAAAIVWRMGDKATDSAALDAMALVNAVAQGIGGLDAILPADIGGADLVKAMPKAKADAQGKAADKRAQGADAPSGSSGSRNGPVTVKAPKTDKARLDVLLPTVAAVKSGKSNRDAVRSLLAHAMRLAVDCLPAEEVADIVAEATAPADAEEVAEAI